MPKATRGSEPIEALLKERPEVPAAQGLRQGARGSRARRSTARRARTRCGSGSARPGSSAGSSRGGRRSSGSRPTPSGSSAASSTSPTTAWTGTSRRPRRNKAAHHLGGRAGRHAASLTYWDLYREVNRFAAALKRHGVKKGDRVTIYMPMVPELPIAMLACARIGAPHSVVFGGFAPESAARPHPRRRGQGRHHRRRRLPARRHGAAQEEHRRGAQGVPERRAP